MCIGSQPLSKKNKSNLTLPGYFDFAQKVKIKWLKFFLKILIRS